MLTPTSATNGIQYVRLTILSNQTPNRAVNCPDGGFSGCSFADFTELAVVGSPSP